MKITFLGAGAFGNALAKVANYNGHETKFFDPYKYPDVALAAAISGADVVVFSAPSKVAPEILPQLDPDTPLICASKGFLSLKPFEKFKDFSVLSGAAFSDEVEATTSNPNSRKLILTATSVLSEELFSTENITIEYTTDKLGVLLCGALKNIYAIGAGIYYQKSLDDTCGPTAEEQNSDEVSDNTEAQNSTPLVSMLYLEKAVSEMIKILEANGASRDTLRLSCGAADLVLSSTGRSRNFCLGRELAKIKAAVSNNDTKKLDGQMSGTVEGASVILGLSNYPDFVLPSDTTIFHDTVKIVKDYYAAQ